MRAWRGSLYHNIGWTYFERGEHAVRKVTRRPLERLPHRRPDAIVSHHVRLHRVAAAGAMTGGLDRHLSGMHRNIAFCIDERDLPYIRCRIRRNETAQRLLLERKDAAALKGGPGDGL